MIRFGAARGEYKFVAIKMEGLQDVASGGLKPCGGNCHTHPIQWKQIDNKGGINMDKVININKSYKRSKEYIETIDETIQYLEEIEEVIFSQIVSLATAGKWKEWSDSMPVGTEFNFTDEMLRDTGDPNVDAMKTVLDNVIDTKNKLIKLK